jgi:hypothetical protein
MLPICITSSAERRDLYPWSRHIWVGIQTLLKPCWDILASTISGRRHGPVLAPTSLSHGHAILPARGVLFRAQAPACRDRHFERLDDQTIASRL